MAHEVTPISERDFGSLSVNDLLPERPAIIGEFNSDYEPFRVATLADLAPMTKYEFLLAQQLVDLNWSILQAKVSADIELSEGAENLAKLQLTEALENECEEKFDRLYEKFVENGGDTGDFEDPVEWDSIAPRVEDITVRLKSRDAAERKAATDNAISLGVDPRLIMSSQLLNNAGYRRHTEKLPDLEKRARLLSAEYREVQKSRPIDVVPVAGD